MKRKPAQAMVVSTPDSVLQEVFGYRDFRGQQRAIIESAIQGRDALVIIPTGGGNSFFVMIT
jgi:ATP-dependent DNA helicase RecQ